MRDSRDTLTLDKKEKRSPRISLVGGRKLTVPDRILEEGYHYSWPLDKPGELERFQAAWYEFVLDEGNKITRPAGRGLTHYLMRIKQEYYDEDVEKEQARVNDALIRDAKLQEDEYVPKGKNGVLTRDVIV